MTGYYEIKNFTIDINDKIIEKQMIVFFDLEGKELTREIFINSDEFIFDENSQLRFIRIYDNIDKIK
ncbi:hypothetical protein [Flavobacterium sp.]|uniref:hypothetical protein n=1 Tax=Flavobacterium sp. TaxID=239 RepID=UPI002FDECF6C